MIMKCNSTLYWHAALLYSVNYSLFTLTSIFWSHYLITLSKSPFPLINPTLSFICDPLFLLPSLILFTPFLSFSFAAHWCLFFFRGWLDYPCRNSCYSDFRSSTKSIRGKITPFFSYHAYCSAVSHLLAPEFYSDISHLPQFCRLRNLRLLCYQRQMFF